MGKLIRMELKKILQDRYLLIFTVILMVLYYWMSHFMLLSPEDLRLRAETTSISYLAGVFGGKAENFSELRVLYSRYVLRHVFSDASAISWMSIVFAGFVISRDFDKRTMNIMIYRGYSRWRILFSKVLIYYIYACVVSLVPTLVTLKVYAPGWTSAFSMGFLVRSILLKLLLDMGMISFPIIFAFLFQNPLKSISASLLVTFLLLKLKGESLLGDILRYYPGALIMRDELWSQAKVMDTQLKVAAVLSPLIFIVASVGISFAIFRKSDLK